MHVLLLTCGIVPVAVHGIIARNVRYATRQRMCRCLRDASAVFRLPLLPIQSKSKLSPVFRRFQYAARACSTIRIISFLEPRRTVFQGSDEQRQHGLAVQCQMHIIRRERSGARVLLATEQLKAGRLRAQRGEVREVDTLLCLQNWYTGQERKKAHHCAEDRDMGCTSRCGFSVQKQGSYSRILRYLYWPCL